MPQLGTFQPIKGEQGALDPPHLGEGEIQPVLALERRQHLEHHGGRDSAGLDRRRQADDVLPVLLDQIDPDRTAKDRFQGLVPCGRPDNREPAILQIAHSRNEAVAKEMAEREDVVRRATRVGVMLAAWSADQPVKNVRRLRRRGREHPRIE